ncbi:LytR/AlgR family response regulator transcription factor [Aquimarina sp. 2201CG14-23]|uniref:LytR/AlgR family response regulator transcription factor n=1 Tax=Aquimarina mycalae TaxID=3040073 RepID=UPI002478094C|nr:LytTR family DNA-binding domain-containing protein [Aquimarina sp. 2201CG14-23]MDH7448213.1 LytTR family DNA-binding domain-containing protein [Aquimarina sp. 2201CG14-23]
MEPFKVEEKSSTYLDKMNIDLNDLKNTSLSNLDTSLKIQKQIIRHTSDGIIIGFYIKSKHAGLGLSNKVNSLYKTPALFSSLQEAQEEIDDTNIKDRSTTLFIKCGNKLIKVAVDTILYAHTDSKNYCSIITSDGKKLSVRYSITSLLKALGRSFFTQTHRSYIINWQKIDSFHEYDQTIEIQGYHIPVGRTYKEDLYKKMKVI